MTSPQLDRDGLVDEVTCLAMACLSGDAQPDDMVRLDQLLRDNDEACRVYVRVISDSSCLRQWEANEISKTGESVLPGISLASSHDPSSNAASTWSLASWPVAYFAAGIVFAIAGLIGSLIDVSPARPVAGRSTTTPSERTSPDQQSTVGRITGMADCRWAGPSVADREVVMGCQYALASGLLEITYDTGAKVILQGPANYEVNSATGGYLAAGKLTARVEKKAEGGRRKAEEVTSGQWPVAGESQIANLRSDVPDSPPSPLRLPPSLSTSHCPLFTIETPTAIVTDLGTEFGVEVDDRGGTTSYVFQGTVRVQGVDRPGAAGDAGRVLRANESVRVERRGDTCELVVPPTDLAAVFVRDLQQPAGRKGRLKVFDLVDVVAGGDGFSGKRGRGIDPRSGHVVATPTEFSATAPLISDNEYHRVEEMPFVDGVFIPDGNQPSVQIDSAGGRFEGFHRTVGKTWQPIWAGGPMPEAYPTNIWGIDVNSPGHGAIVLHASNAITFDLDAIRNANPGCRLEVFRAIAGNCDSGKSVMGNTYADLSVLVDGKVRYRRRQIQMSDGGYSVIVPIENTDRFLTLVATDGGDDISHDWVVFGDPRLEMTATEQ